MPVGFLLLAFAFSEQGPSPLLRPVMFPFPWDDFLDLKNVQSPLLKHFEQDEVM